MTDSDTKIDPNIRIHLYTKIENEPDEKHEKKEIDLINNFKQISKISFDKNNSTSNILSAKQNSLTQNLIIKNMDFEQIWQQIDHIQKQNFKYFDSFSAEIEAKVDELGLANDEKQESESESLDQDNMTEMKFENKKSKKSSKQQEDDFNINDMNIFLDKMEENEQSGSDNDLGFDMYAGSDEDEQNEDEYNLDKDSNTDSENDSGEDLAEIFGGKVDDKKSSREQKLESIQRKTENLEESNLASNKIWQRQGEASSKNRPVDSLLSEYLDFDTLAKSAPVISNEFTDDLEELIKSRIRDCLFDNVERKFKPREDIDNFKNKLVLNAEKSKETLAQIYEKEYLKAKNPNQIEENPDKPKHVSIQNDMLIFFNKLDALTNYTFVPKPAMPEITIVSNKPAVNTESVGLNSTTPQLSSQLAPEEISQKDKYSNDLKGTEELNKTDKNRIRRAHKAFVKTRAEIERVKQDKGDSKANRRSRKRGIQIDKVNVKNQKLTSAKFFSSLENAKIVIPGANEKKKKKIEESRRKSILKLKL